MNKSFIDHQLLIDLLREKDKVAFEFLWDTYSPALHGSIIDIVANKEIAAKVLEDAFITAWIIIDSYDNNKQRLFTWLRHIARRLAIDTLHSIGAFPSASQLEEVSGQMRTVLQTMDKSQRSVIEFMYYKGYSVRQTAEILNISVEAASNLLKIGLLQLQSYINGYHLE